MLCQLLLLLATTTSRNEWNRSGTIHVNSLTSTAPSSAAVFNITFYIQNWSYPLTFNNTLYASGEMGSYPVGNYTAQADLGIVGNYPCHSGTVFSHWSLTGGLSVNNRNNRTTIVGVTGNGTLTAVYQNVNLCNPLSPISIITALFAGLIVASLIRANQRRGSGKNNRLEPSPDASLP